VVYDPVEFFREYQGGYCSAGDVEVTIKGPYFKFIRSRSAVNLGSARTES
jgi:hypothetical protein